MCRFRLWLLVLLGMLLSTAAPAAELVMFDEAGCVWCRRWDAEVGVGYPKSEEGQRAPLRRIDISRAASAGIRLASPVRATPTFVLAEAGVEVGRITGYPGADFFWGMLGELLARLAPASPTKPEPEKPRDADATGAGDHEATRPEPAHRQMRHASAGAEAN